MWLPEVLQVTNRTAECIKTRTMTTTTKITTVTTARVIMTRRHVTVLSYTTTPPSPSKTWPVAMIS